MQKKHILFWGGAIIISGIAFVFSYLYQDITRYLNEESIEILKEASSDYFGEEWHKMELVSVTQSSPEEIAVSYREVADSVNTVICRIDKRKDSLNISDTSEGRINESAVMAGSCFSIDSLRVRWDKALLKEGIFSDNALRITKLKSKEKESILSYSELFVCDSSYTLGDLYGGLESDFLLEPFIHHTISTVLRKDHRLIWLFGGIVVSTLSFIFYKRLKKTDEPVCEEEISTTVPVDTDPCIDPSCYSLLGLSYSEQVDAFTLDKKRTVLRPQLHILFSLFLKWFIRNLQ